MDHEELKRNNQKAAARRFRYLLRQSGMLDFFRGGLFEIGDEAAADLAPATKQESRRSGRTSPSSKEEEEEDVAPDYLTHQPSCVVGGTMRSYQLEGLNWMIRLRNNGLNGILADEMGLGKTLQSISMLAYLHEYKNVSGPHLVLVPKTTLSNWLNEFSRWLPALRVVKFHGTKEERALTVSTILEGVTTKKKQQRERSWDVIVTTYEVANLEKTTLSRLAWRFLVVDEAHRIKNENAQLSKTVRMLKVENRLLITGTPLQNNLHELWALLNFLLPDIFASAERFDELFDLQIVDADAKKAIIAQLHKLLRPFVLRRLKHDVETSLPPKSETILFCSMSDAQREVYRHCLLREIDVVQAGGQRTAVLNLAMQLRKCCNHPYLFPNVEDRSLPPLGEHLVTNCGKLHLLDKLMSRLRARDHRVLVFSQMTRMLDILEDYVVMRRYEYCRIDGKTPHDLREAQIDAYNAPGSTKFIFLLSTRAGGLGVNLQTADTCVLYDSDWNPQADLQAMDRCHRIGQTKPVHVYRLVTEHSIEEKVVERAQQKLKLDAMVVQQGRLQDKERKIATETLLSAVRFGADKVFRPEKEVTDDDMDAIIARGQKRTAELEARLASADKGDMLDFKLDGGMDTQQWEGVDYSDLAIRQQLKNADDPSQTPFVLDTGKRERKKTSQTIYEERTAPASSSKKHHKDDNKSGGGADKDDAASSSGGGAGGSGKKDDSKGDGPPSKKKKKDKTNSSNNDDDDAPAAANGRAHAKDDPYHKPLKLPPHLRLPKLEEWQLFEHKDRLLALQAKEDEKMHELQSNHDKKLELLRDPWKYHSLQLLTDAEFAEKRRLFAQGFPRWSKHYYQAFVKASARHGREAYEKISEDLFKFTPQDVEAYATAFWTNGQKFLSSAEWDRVCRAVEKGERKLEEMEQLMKTTVRFVDLFKPNPRRNLVFRFTNTSAGIPQFPGLPSRPDEEAILLSLLVEHGYGNWRTIRSHYQRAPELSFDWFLRSLDCDAVQKRAEALMRAAEKELAELERRHQAYLAAEQAIAAARAGVPKNPKTGRPYSQPERVALMFEKMRTDHKKQADLRSEIKAAKLQAALSGASASAAATEGGGGGGSGGSSSGGSNYNNTATATTTTTTTTTTNNNNNNNGGSAAAASMAPPPPEPAAPPLVPTTTAADPLRPLASVGLQPQPAPPVAPGPSALQPAQLGLQPQPAPPVAPGPSALQPAQLGLQPQPAPPVAPGPSALQPAQLGLQPQPAPPVAPGPSALQPAQLGLQPQPAPPVVPGPSALQPAQLGLQPQPAPPVAPGPPALQPTQPATPPVIATSQHAAAPAVILPAAPQSAAQAAPRPATPAGGPPVTTAPAVPAPPAVALVTNKAPHVVRAVPSAEQQQHQRNELVGPVMPLSVPATVATPALVNGAHQRFFPSPPRPQPLLRPPAEVNMVQMRTRPELVAAPSGTKRPRPDDDKEEEAPRASSPAFDDATLSAAGPPPKKPRSALRCFMRHHVRELRNQNPQSTESQLRATLTEMWERASPAERTEMDRRSELDKIRYEREQAEFMARISTMPLPPSARHSLV